MSFSRQWSGFQHSTGCGIIWKLSGCFKITLKQLWEAHIVKGINDVGQEFLSLFVWRYPKINCFLQFQSKTQQDFCGPIVYAWGMHWDLRSHSLDGTPPPMRNALRPQELQPWWGITPPSFRLLLLSRPPSIDLLGGVAAWHAAGVWPWRYCFWLQL